MKIVTVPDAQWQEVEDRISDAHMSSGQTEDSFLAEFETVSEQLKSALGQQWSERDYEFAVQFEFFMEFCRVVAMGMYGPRTFCQEFISTIQKVLAKQPAPWAVHISAEPEGFSGQKIEWALLLVEKDIVHVQQEGPKSPYPALFEGTLEERESANKAMKGIF